MSQSQPVKLTYREKRRLDQAELRRKFPNAKRRGPTRGKKYASRNQRNHEEKIKICFMDELRRVVGEKADEFICDCSKWVKEFCPLNSWNWAKMDSVAQDRLYAKIKGKYDLPERVDDVDVTEVLKLQCSMLYRNWRFRLKESHFRGKSKAQASSSRPTNIDREQWEWLVYEYWGSEKQEEISKVNTINKLNQIETPANGSRSTARFFYDLINELPTQVTQDSEETFEPGEIQEDPLYVRLFEKTKRHKPNGESNGWEPNAEKNYQELKKLHQTQMEKHGEDTLTVKAAYTEVLKPKSGYVKGLGPGARTTTRGRSEAQNNELNVKFSAEIQMLKNDAAVREASLVGQIDTLKKSNEELRASNDQLKASNEELKTSISQMSIDAVEREKKLREDVKKMLEEMRMGF
ncbi:unnamed protein product [Cuscuta epithymum]|uniref:Transposase, Ptta/En/Spm, plant n=2 Tax=Cuscuta epithymum TaxID=186058 RepID=A0AAV0D2U6_9ASTE|nr:unnamed protein product [Cuscuta epithymum]